MIALSGIGKSFGGEAVLSGIDLDIAEGEFIALLGPSGSGKTTLLRIIAGLEQQDAGTVAIAGRDVSQAGVAERGIGFVFQHYALFRHMRVLDNIGFGLTVRRGRGRGKDRLTRSDIAARAEELLRLVQLGGLGDRYPAQLSGGQRQRVALARALATRPRLLLLDEPFGALDARVRKDLRRWLHGLHKQMGLTSIFVTHDQEEALELADRVVVMNAGRIEQVGTPEQVYSEPASAFVSQFVGETNLLPPLDLGDAERHVRPHELVAANGKGGEIFEVDNVYRKGPVWRIEGRLAGWERLVEIDRSADEPPPTRGERISIRALRSRSFG